MAGLREPAERKTTASLCAQTAASSSCENRSFGGQQTEEDDRAEGSPGARGSMKMTGHLSARGSRKTSGARGSRKKACTQQEDGLRAAAGRRPARDSGKACARQQEDGRSRAAAEGGGGGGHQREREVYLRGEESGEESGLGTEPLRPLNFLERDGSGSGENILLLEPLRSSFFLTKQHQNWDGTVPFYFAP
jgi:hypothetical protein